MEDKEPLASHELAAEGLSLGIVRMIGEELVEVSRRIMPHPGIEIDTDEEQTDREARWIERLGAQRIIARRAQIGRLEFPEDGGRREVRVDIIRRPRADTPIDEGRLTRSPGSEMRRRERAIFWEVRSRDHRAELVEFPRKARKFGLDALKGEPLVERLLEATLFFGAMSALSERVDRIRPSGAGLK